MNTTNQYRELKTVEDVRRAQGEGLVIESDCPGDDAWGHSSISISTPDYVIASCLGSLDYRAILPADAGDGLESEVERVVNAMRGKKNIWRCDLVGDQISINRMTEIVTAALTAYREARK